MVDSQHQERRTKLIERFVRVRAATETLTACLSPEDQLLQSMPNCSPTKWHRAHTTWFFEEFLLIPSGYPPINPQYRVLFNSYYVSVGARHPRPQRGLLSRPTCDEVSSYRRAIDDQVIAFLSSLKDAAFQKLAPLFELGLAHEEQHQELILSDILHAFFQSSLGPTYRAPPRVPPHNSRDATQTLVSKIGVDHATESSSFKEIEGGLCVIGAQSNDGEFYFDNEGPQHRVWVEPFSLATRPIDTAALAAFLEADGYQNPSYWLSEGFDWVRASGRRAPLYWAYENGSLRRFTLDGWVEPEQDSPVCHLSYYEADALARFLDARLPTEQEWEICATPLPEDRGNFVESGELRPVPLPRKKLGPKESPEIDQMFGDVWEWTASAYAPYPSFQAPSGAVGEYNGKFMVNQIVLRGGSCWSPRGHLRASYRNFWHPDTQFQMSGARLARSPGKKRKLPMAKAIWQGVVLAEGDRFEIVEGNVYFPREALRAEYFRPSQTHTTCGWKGVASYYDVVVGDRVNKDAAWYYPTPKEEAKGIADHVAFWKGVQVER